MTAALRTGHPRPLPYYLAATAFSTSTFLFAVLCNLRWPAGWETAAVVVLAFAAACSGALMHRLRPSESLRVTGYVATQCASITLLLQLAFLLLQSSP